MRLAEWLLMLCLVLPCSASAQETEKSQDRETGFSTGFDAASGDWEMTDPAAWKFDEGRLRLFRKKSSYEPEVRSPRHIAWLKDRTFEGFQLDVKILSTHKDYNHRDVCLFFGCQSPTRFYYVHLGKATDPHANQIFIVNDAARTKISLTTTDGTPWDDDWHQVRIKRDVQSGEIQVFFDDMETPAMTAMDKTFTSGRIGLGSFDDTADFDDLVIQSGAGR